MKSATRHLITECEELPEMDPTFENTVNNEYAFTDDADLEK